MTFAAAKTRTVLNTLSTTIAVCLSSIDYFAFVFPVKQILVTASRIVTTAIRLMKTAG